MRRLLIMLALLLLTLPYPAARARAAGTKTAVSTAIAFIGTQQQADGTFKGFGAGSTADAVYALELAGVRAASYKHGGASALDGLRKLAPQAAKQTGLAAKFLLAAELAGDAQLAQTMREAVAAAFAPATGLFAKDATTQALAILAQVSKDVPSSPLRALKSLQLSDGGWSFDGTVATGSDTNTTALVVQALMASEGSSDAVRKAVAYLRGQQNADAGFPYSQTSPYGHDSDANSTAYVIQGLLAAGEKLSTYARQGRTPLDRLLAFQNKSGAFRFQDTATADNAGATYQAVPALLGRTFPYVGNTVPAVTPAVPTPRATARPPMPQPTPGPAAGGPPARLPNTGDDDGLLWLLLLAGGTSVVAGWTVLRRRGVGSG